MLLNIGILSCFISLVFASKCVPKDFGHGGTVCVCNKEYCDKFSPIPKLETGQFVLYSSNKAGLRFNKTVGQFGKVDKQYDNSSPNRGIFSISPHHKTDPTLIIDAKIKFQSIHGFGGAFTDSTGINILSLDEDLQEMILRSYFGPEGLEYSLCRVPIGGTDFSTHPYTNDDVSGDITLEKWNLTIEDHKYKIPFIKRAQDLSKKQLKLFGTPWTAPPWMKTNNAISGLGFLKTEFYQLWADYYLKFLIAYEAEGVPFWGLTTGNEPINGFLPMVHINSMGWTPFGQSKWISENLGPTMRNSTFKDVKLMALDDQRFFLPWWLKLLFKNNETLHYIDGIAVHWYYDKIIPAYFLDKTHKLYPDKFILGSEACMGDKPWDKRVKLGSWSRAENYANDIIEDLNHWVTGWVDWNMALNTEGGPTYINNNVDAPIIINAGAQEFYKQPMYYALGHFSKLIPVDSIRIDTKLLNAANLKVTAFLRPDNATTLIISNTENHDISVTISDERRGEFSVSITKHSINSIVYW